MKIDARALTTWSVTEGGDTISLGLIDGNGQAVDLKVSAADACAIAMTLPRLLKDAIRKKYSDNSLRYTFPLDSWQIETASDGSQIIVTFTTGHGFEVSFSTKPNMCQSLGMALREGTELRTMRAAPAVN